MKYDHEVNLFVLFVSLFRIFHVLVGFGFIYGAIRVVCVRVIIVIIFGGGRFWYRVCLGRLRVRSMFCLSSWRNMFTFYRRFL